MQELLYKYRGIQNFRFFLDIVIKNRLYAARYTELNDPMEGQYYYSKGELNNIIKQKLANEKGNLRICSLSRVKNNELLWSHYAEGHRGVVIGLKINREEYQVKPIDYTGLLQLNKQDLAGDSAIEILTHKLSVWEYEEEERVFTRDNKFYIDVEVMQIITGRAMSPQDYSFIRELLNQLNSNIELIKADSFM